MLVQIYRQERRCDDALDVLERLLGTAEGRTRELLEALMREVREDREKAESYYRPEGT